LLSSIVEKSLGIWALHWLGQFQAV
jgi:hypothetical protein